MATYLKLFTDYAETFDDMSDAEAGRLIKAILHYGASGEVRTLSGGERLVFGIIKRQIDRDNESADSHREAGKSGGRPKTKWNQTKPNETKQNQTEPNFSEKEKEEDKDEENIGAPPPARARARESAEITLTAEDVEAARHLDDTIRSAAQNAGLTVTPDGLEYGRRLAVTYGLDALLDAIHKAVDNPRWRYVEGILSTPDTPRQAFTVKQPRRNTVQDKLAQLQADIERGKYSDAS